ncbi:MAG: glutamate 5-kinase [Bacteroidetes bacterium]|nr:MAG: glutamate 5-kinase [Bacteroidota bacterium]
MTHRKYLKHKERIVVKVGTSLLTYENGKINLARMEKLVRVLADLHNSGKEVILVSSGAVGAGVGMLGFDKRPGDKVKRQALAAIGQVGLIRLYQKFFDEYSTTVAQVLLTRDGIENSIRRKNARNTLLELMNMGIVPVVNENDTVVTYEIEFGDNDTLSASVATLVHADLLIILTDTDGVFTADPRVDRDATRVNKVLDVESDLRDINVEGTSRMGRGGMASKVAAAKHCKEQGLDVVIADGTNPSTISKILDGQDFGTFFVSEATKNEENLAGEGRTNTK